MAKTKKSTTNDGTRDRPQFICAHAPIPVEHMKRVRDEIESKRRDHGAMIKRGSAGLPNGDQWEELVVNDLAGDLEPGVALIYSSKSGAPVADIPLLSKSLNREWSEFFGMTHAGKLHFTVRDIVGHDLVAVALFVRQFSEGARSRERELLMRTLGKVGAPPVIVKSLEVLMMMEEAQGPDGPCPCGKTHGSKSNDGDSVEVPDGECAH